ncbi:RagB/SusD family nutrient uptake outer membrane protein [Mucilaginibacter sp. UR6-11]|uniref:RagB/SusD family nutrient uptake outer membrane protein n=1 Tax=Mucilaginibacter sp. UR6-11 TaxID=1435644 RepID=UPI001E4511E2|nr:RagB/SusD family nutrient uptake outer membrane protein [Mucilaginibacter sp. UR6-11]MCC8425951.1 RagB/SusD family nutrient uptake outer membrane protein [Mucilaginibacter sp. UR6-11]
MKTYQIFLLTAAFSCMLASCQKYLDIKQNSNQNFITTANDCQLLLDNYATMNVLYPSDGEASADDYYLFDARYAALSQENKDFYSWQPTAQRALAIDQWQNPYRIVFNANLALEGIAKQNTATSDQATLNSIRGQALFFRSFAFYALAQLYTAPYNAASANQDPGIPLKMTSDLNEVSSRGTVQQTYTRILQDLQEAVTLLPTTSPVNSRPNKVAAYAMLARVYLAMQDYPNALINANAALALNNKLINYNSLSTTSSTPFTPRFQNIEDIFHAVMVANNALLNPATSATSNVAKIDPDLVASYATTDLRKSVFLKANTVTVKLPINLSNPAVTANVTVPDGSYRFSGNYEPVTNSALYTGLATDELYLIAAECNARAGNADAAMAGLNALLIKRYKTGTYTAQTASNATDALNKVLDERRKELLMRGLRWTDLRRLNKGAVRKTRTITFTGTTTSPIRTETITATYTLAPNDLRYALLLPTEVITNTNGGLQQNRR